MRVNHKQMFSRWIILSIILFCNHERKSLDCRPIFLPIQYDTLVSFPFRSNQPYFHDWSAHIKLQICPFLSLCFAFELQFGHGWVWLLSMFKNNIRINVLVVVQCLPANLDIDQCFFQSQFFWHVVGIASYNECVDPSWAPDHSFIWWQFVLWF